MLNKPDEKETSDAIDRLWQLFLERQIEEVNLANYVSDIVVDNLKTTRQRDMTGVLFRKMKETFPIMKVREESGNSFSLEQCRKVINIVLNEYIRRAENGIKPKHIHFTLPNMEKEYQSAMALKKKLG